MARLELPPGYELFYDDDTGSEESDGWQITIRGNCYDGRLEDEETPKDYQEAVDECWDMWARYDGGRELYQMLQAQKDAVAALTPNSTRVEFGQVFDLLRALIPTLGLDPAQEIGLNETIKELDEVSDLTHIDAEIQEALSEQKEDIEADHNDEIEALKNDHCEKLEEEREKSYNQGVEDSETAIDELFGEGKLEKILESKWEFMTFFDYVERVGEARLNRIEEARLKGL